ncbi:MAG: hypothetical protein HY901_15025 [Deltaproteobacteria bacterium]|nr:hypothetical protein [Deltaproteobacteria bacterium]
MVTKKTDEKPDKPKSISGGRVISRHVEELSVKLTDVELKERSKRAAEVEGNMRTHLTHADSVCKSLKAEQDRLDAELAHLSHIVRSETEPREVEIQVELDPDRKRHVLEIRLDTGEVVHRRLAREDELQVDLFPKVDLVALAAECLKNGLTADDVRKLAGARKVDPAALSDAIEVEKKRASEKKVPAAKSIGRKSPARQLAEKLFVEGVRFAKGRMTNEDADKVAKATADAGVPTGEVLEELEGIEERLLKPDRK